MTRQQAGDGIDSLTVHGYNAPYAQGVRSTAEFLSLGNTMEPYTLLIVSRTQSLAKRLAAALAAERYLLRWAASTSQALDLDLEPDLVLLDLVPCGGARSAPRLKRRFDAPLMALVCTGQQSPAAVDVSLQWPCPIESLVSSVESTLLAHAPRLLRAGDMFLDIESRRLQVNGSLVHLRPLGCRILALLIARAGQVVSRDELARQVLGIEDGDKTRTLDVHITHLRRQVEADPRHPVLIITERGVGYRLALPEH